MTRPRARRALLVLLAALWAAPARALSRSGSALWRYDDITTRDASGSAHRNSWYQGYSLDLGGVLLHPLVGTFATGGSYAQGADINTAVNEDVPDQRILTYRGSLQPLSPNLRRFFTFDPNYSLQRTKNAATSSSPEHTYTNKSWGYNSGLNLPRLPAVSVSRQYNSLNDPGSASPTDQRLNLMRESAYYKLGGVVLNASQDRTRTDDLLGNVLIPLERTQRGSLDYGRYDVKALGLKSLSVRTDYLRLTRGEVDAQKTLTNLLSLRSRDFRSGGWTHNLNYWNDTQRDLLANSTLMTHNAQLNGTRPLPRGSMTSSLAANASTGRGGPSRGASVAPGLYLAFLSGRIQTATNGQAGLNRSQSGGSTFNDMLGTRWDFKPRPVLSLFAEARTSGVEALTGDAGGQRTNNYGLGGDRRFAYAQASARVDRTEQRQYATGARSVSDQLNLLGSSNPLDRLNATAGVNYTTTKSEPGARVSSKNFRAGLDYSLRWGLRLFCDASFAEADQYTTNAGATYSLGKTTLSVKYTRTELPASTSYSYLSVSLARAL